MEINTRQYRTMWLHLCLGALLFIFIQMSVAGQQMLNPYTVKNGKMYITLSKELKVHSLDSFINKYGLTDLGLKNFIESNSTDSLLKSGWKIETNSKRSFTISKNFLAFDDINKAEGKFILTEKHPTLAEMFPAVSNRVIFGYNKFINKPAFATNENIVIFLLHNNLRATKVMLAGSFNKWDPDALAMTKTETGWIANVKLAPGKYWYKFIIDGNWNVDNDNLLRENDGRGNINSVFYKTNTVFALNSFPDARRVFVAGSFNNWRRSELEMKKTTSGWQLPLYLGQGTHTYKYIVDGTWYGADKNRDRLPDGYGEYNFVLKLGKPYLFKLKGYENAKQVMLVGSFNTWRDFELQMNKTTDGWSLPYVIGPGNYEYRFIVDGKSITDPENELTSNNDNKGNSFLVIEPNYTFRLRNFSNAKNVFLSGDLNSWNPGSLRMKRDGADWVFQVHLDPGKHRYKFVVDGKWIIDPNNKLWEQNEYNTGNSIIWIE